MFGGPGKSKRSAPLHAHHVFGEVSRLACSDLQEVTPIVEQPRIQVQGLWR
jgi:hypothetical protein